ncbi:MAG: putative T7SS-secreted protein, partial [Sciscionella sp.]
HLRTFATAFGETAKGLAAVDTGHWEGTAADAFRAKYQKHPRQWADAHEACGKAATALSSYGRTVKWAQGQAKQAIELYKKGKQASEHAKQEYQQQVDTYNASARQYNSALAAGQDPGGKPTQPAAFSDPGQAQMQRAKQILADARKQRNSAAGEAAQAVSAGTTLAPKEPSFSQRMLNDGADLVHGAGVADEHLVGGVLKGTGDIVKFARSLNPADPYNITHPAAYVDGLSTTAAGLLHGVNHPVELVQSMVGSGWGSDPFEAFGKLVPNVALAVGTDGAGTAADAAASAGERAAIGAGEDAAERGVVGAGEDAAGRGVQGEGENAGRSATRDGVDDPRDPARDDGSKSCPGEPIDAATGSLLLTQNDVMLPGALPLSVDRHHCTSYTAGRWFGPTWASTLDIRIEVDAEGVVFTRGDGVILFYPHPGDDGTVLPEEGARWPLARAVDGGYTVTDPASGRRLHFDSRAGGVLPVSALTDRGGNRIAFYYDADGAPTEIHHDGGYRLRVSTQDGRVTALAFAGTETDTELMRYGYTGGNLTEVVNASGQPLRFAYNSADWITEWTDRNGTWYRYTYDSAGRCVYEIGSDGLLEYTFDYDGVDRDTGDQITTVTNSLGATTRYHINDAKQVVAEVDALGGVTRQEWDRYDRLLARTDPAGRTTRYGYDSDGNLVTLTRPDRSQALAEYNELGLPTVLVEPDGGVWRQSYDERGNRIAVTDPAGATTRCEYDAHGNVMSIVDALGHRRSMEFDACGLPVAVTDEIGARTAYARNGFGLVTAVIDPLGGVTELGWTVDGRLASRTHPDGARESWSYDGEGNLVGQVDATGAVTRTEYTHFDLPAARTTPDGARLAFDYDSELRLVSVTNPQGLVWRYTYDPAGRMVAETDFNGRELRYSYDAVGQLVERINGVGQRVRYTRDLLGNVVRQRASSEPGAEAVTTFEHDPMGRLLRAVGPDAELAYHRDPLGRVLAETVNGRTVRCRYDAVGRRVSRHTPSGAVSAWEYDPAGRPVRLSTAGRVVWFDRDVAGREVRRHLGAGTVLAQDWDINHRLIAQTLSTVAGPAAPIGPVGRGLPEPETAVRHRVVQRRAYAYRADGYLVGVEDALTGHRRFDLDGVGRVRAVHGDGWAERYAYDSAGNITSADWPAAPAAREALGSREYAGTLIRRAGGVRYQHDAQGRIVLRQKARLSRKPDIWHYAWDADDRLVGVRTPDGQRWRYSYDPLGRRIAKLRLGSDGVSVVQRVDFVWDGTTLAEQSSTDPGVANVHTTVWDYDVDGVRPIAQTERVEWREAPQSWVDERFYGIVTDLVGMPSELVDVAGGLAWYAISTLWGTMTYRSAGASTPLRFPGQYFDAETGLNY